MTDQHRRWMLQRLGFELRAGMWVLAPAWMVPPRPPAPPTAAVAAIPTVGPARC